MSIKLAALSTFLALSSAWAQCTPHWLPGDALPGVRGLVNAMTPWDPDGPGPRGPLAVLGGRFDYAGSVASSAVAAWDPADGSWLALPGLADDITIKALTVRNGQLIAAGDSPYAIKRWNGAAWATIGQADNMVSALASAPNGDVYAAGSFMMMSGLPAAHIARWNGARWAYVGGGTNNAVAALAITPAGDLIAAGAFQEAGGAATGPVARWNGAAWAAVGADLVGEPRALAILPDGRIVAGGSFQRIGGVGGPNGRPVGAWNGQAWAPLGLELEGIADTLAVLPDGSIVAAGFSLTMAGRTVGVARWNGAAWTPHRPSANGAYNAVVAEPGPWNGRFLLGGSFTQAGDAGVAGFTRWNGSQYESLGLAPAYEMTAMVALPDGGLVAGGMRVAGGRPANFAALWRDGRWSPLHGIPNGGFTNSPWCLARLANGHIVAGGAFDRADEAPADNVALWNGSRWLGLGGGVNGIVTAAIGLPDGDLVVGGAFTLAGGVPALHIARWDGAAWRPLGPGINGQVDALALLPNGDLVAGGYFTAAGDLPANRVARWDGAAWSPLGAGFDNGVTALAVLDSGRLVAAGAFRHAEGAPVDRIAAWDGAAWSPMGLGLGSSGQPAFYSLVPLPGGRLLAAGNFASAGGNPAARTALWDGAAWSPLDAGLNGRARAAALLADGSVAVAGRFTTAGDQISANLARYTGLDPRSDFTRDGVLDFRDYAAFVACFENGACPPGRDADFNRDGFADFFDYADFVAAFESGC